MEQCVGKLEQGFRNRRGLEGFILRRIPPIKFQFCIAELALGQVSANVLAIGNVIYQRREDL
ncbi:MAG TPA: hypothetical protein VMZ26_08655 [Pyrinomonadaceae bacterium]|nr:hypothetical protein [Pyrinomonadaceae bacterium]